MKDILILLKDIGLAGFLDMFFMWLMIYTLMVWSKKTRAASVLTGILIVAGFYLLVRYFNLTLTAAVFEQFFAVILIALVVIFQEELRHFFEQVAVWSLNRHLSWQKPTHLSREEVATLVRTVHDLAKEKIGALIVIRGKDLILRHLTGGVDLNGRLSEALLKSLFDPHSIGHDGAVLIESGIIQQFSCYLPLSKNIQKIGKGGTRHAAALGLSELSDALAIVVSEERGVISVARNGELIQITEVDRLAKILDDFYQEVYPKQKVKPFEGFVRHNSREKTMAVVLAIALWFVLVYGQKTTYNTFMVPVSFEHIPDSLVLKEIDPPNVYATLSGPRNAFYFLEKKIKLTLMIDEAAGWQKIRIYPTDLVFPKRLNVEILAPQEIYVLLDSREKEAEPAKGGENVVISTIKKVLPFSGPGDARPVPAQPPQGPSEPITGEIVPEVLKKEEARSVSPLENVEPKEVIKYLEKSLDTPATIEPQPAEPKPETKEGTKPAAEAKA